MSAIEIFLGTLAFLGLCLSVSLCVTRLKMQAENYKQARKEYEQARKESEELNRENFQLLKEVQKFLIDANKGRICKFCERELKTETKG
ncbi:MAG: hypothetical protein FWG63_02995 [Defluviitaleaceae bacterium]|nr:hypothetical protein [Defluviitaleaceae bacterium]